MVKAMVALGLVVACLEALALVVTCLEGICLAAVVDSCRLVGQGKLCSLCTQDVCP